jgi:cyclopropane fatty-acyl-phospholipid synthase-like methyltransferase
MDTEEKSIVSTIDWSVAKLIELASQYNSVLDIGCGTGSTIKKVKAKHRFGIDACQAVIDAARKGNMEGVDFYCLDLHGLAKFWKRSVECIIGIDIIEHLEPGDAVQLLKDCEQIATKCLMFFVPVGKHPQTKDDRGFGNDFYQIHRSTWYPKDMEELGYEVRHYPEWHKNVKPPKEKGAMWCRKILE